MLSLKVFFFLTLRLLIASVTGLFLTSQYALTPEK